MTKTTTLMRCNGCHEQQEGTLVEAPLPDLRNTLWVRPPKGWFVTTAFSPAGEEIHKEGEAEAFKPEHEIVMAMVLCARCMALGRVVKIPEGTEN